MKHYPWQERLLERLLEKRGSLPHALLLKGRSGIGKLDFASGLAGALLCESPLPGGNACGTCLSCSWFGNSIHPDFRIIEPDAEATESGRKASRITIDRIRELQPFMNMTTHRNGYRIVLIHPADAMNLHAANALLKTLEEPRGRTLFLLVTHKPHQLLPTILSRCHAISMPCPAPAEAERWLKDQGVADPSSLLSEAGQAPLVALDMAGQDASMKERFLGEISSPASMDPLAVSEAFQKTELVTILIWLQKWCHDLASYAFSGEIRYFPGLSARITEVSGRVDKVELMRFQRKLCQAQKMAHHPLNAKLFIEELILGYRALSK